MEISLKLNNKSDFINIINHLNKLNNTIIFEYNILEKSIDYVLNNFTNLIFIDSGGTCLCLLSNNNLIKICKKNNNTLNNFKYYVNILLINNLIPLTEILYEDSDSLIYLQKKIDTYDTINNNFYIDILEIFVKILKLGFKLTDIYYRNFGYDNGKIYLIDIHDFVDINDNNDLNTINIFNMTISLLYNNLIKINESNQLLNENIIDTYLPIPYSKLIKNFLFNNYSDIDDIILQIKNNLNLNIIKKYKDYQSIKIDINKKIILEGHTLIKYLITNKIITKYHNQFTLLDAGCSLGGIGLNIAQNYNSFITLNNITTNELNTAKEISSLCNITNVEFTNINILNIENKYDITLYFAILHHLLKYKKPEEIIDILKKQTKDYMIIEIPIKGDKLLDLVVNNIVEPWENNYKILESHNNFINFIKNNNLYILESGKIYYPNSNDLNRYYYLIKCFTSHSTNYS